MARMRSCRIPTLTLIFLAGLSCELGAQSPPDPTGVWSGRVQYREERVLDPANLYDTRDTGSRTGSQGDRWRRELWILELAHDDEGLAGAIARLAWERRGQRDPAYMAYTPVAVTNGDDGPLRLEWGVNGGGQHCRAEVHLEDGGTRLRGDFLCRRTSSDRNIIEVISRGEMELHPDTAAAPGDGARR